MENRNNIMTNVSNERFCEIFNSKVTKSNWARFIKTK